jgi:hypothetical protein
MNLGISSAARGVLPLTVSTFEAATGLELTVYIYRTCRASPAAAETCDEQFVSAIL